MALFLDAYPSLSWPSSNMSIVEPPCTFSNRTTSYANDIEMEDISDEEAMDYEITSVEGLQDPVAQVQQVEEDEKIAILLQAQYDAEVHINIGRLLNGREQHNSSLGRSQTRHLRRQLQTIHEDLQTISLFLTSWTPFFTDITFENSFESLLQISIEIGDKSVGLEEHEINVIPTRKFSSMRSTKLTSNGSSSQDCPVCLSEYDDDDMLRTLPCYHEFHVTCIDKWLKLHNTCPICRTEIARQTF